MFKSHITSSVCVITTTPGVLSQDMDNDISIYHNIMHIYAHIEHIIYYTCASLRSVP